MTIAGSAAGPAAGAVVHPVGFDDSFTFLTSRPLDLTPVSHFYCVFEPERGICDSFAFLIVFRI